MQAGRTWNEELNSHMVSEGFAATPKDPAIYVKNPNADGEYAAAGFWVDDCVAIGSPRELASLAKSVDTKYSVTRLGEVRWDSACCSSATAPSG